MADRLTLPLLIINAIIEKYLFSIAASNGVNPFYNVRVQNIHDRLCFTYDYTLFIMLSRAPNKISFSTLAFTFLIVAIIRGVLPYYMNITLVISSYYMYRVCYHGDHFLNPVFLWLKKGCRGNVFYKQ